MEKKFIGIGIGTILVIGVVTGGILYGNLTARPGYSETRVTKGDVTETLNVSGKVAPIRFVDLGFEEGGRITELSHTVGDQVNQGDVLARINDADLLAQYDAALASVRAAQAGRDSSVSLLGKEQEKLTSLKKAGANASDKNAQRDQIDSSEALVKVGQANVDAASASVRVLAAQIEKTVIRAPFSGIVAKQDPAVGESVAVGAPVLTLIDTSDFKMVAYVSETDAKSIRIGNKAELSLDTDAGKTLSAHVTAIDRTETLQNGVSTYKVEVRFDEKVSGVVSGADANVKITLSSVSGAVVVPKDAVYSEGGREFVIISAGGTREKREVSTGIRGDNGMAEILSGLGESDTILKLSQ
ncbi:MAG: efflux RND transporter periplasmic adaptor subunit [Candidatus Moraniibacteriota bacterium]